MKIWEMTISGYKGTKYHKGILLEEFEIFIKELKKEIYEDDLLGYRNKKVLKHYSKMINKLVKKEFVNHAKDGDKVSFIKNSDLIDVAKKIKKDEDVSHASSDKKLCPCGHEHKPRSDGRGLRTYCVKGSQCNSDKCKEFVKGEQHE